MTHAAKCCTLGHCQFQSLTAVTSATRYINTNESILDKNMNFPVFSVITYYGNLHPHQQEECTNAKHHSYWQLILVHFQRVKMPFWLYKIIEYM